MPGQTPDVLIYTEVTCTLGSHFPTERSRAIRNLLRGLPEIVPLRAAAGRAGVFRRLSSVERRALLDRVRSKPLTSCVRMVNRLPQRNRMRLTEVLKLRADVAEADLFLDSEIHVENPTTRDDLLQQLAPFAVSTAALVTSEDGRNLRRPDHSSCPVLTENINAHLAAASAFICTDLATYSALKTHAVGAGFNAPAQNTLPTDPPGASVSRGQSADVLQLLRALAIYA